MVLEGGNAAWINTGLDLEKGPSHLASAPLDRYKRPYEGTNVDPAAAGISQLGVWFGRAAEQGRNPSLLGSVNQSSSLLLFFLSNFVANDANTSDLSFHHIAWL